MIEINENAFYTIVGLIGGGVLSYVVWYYQQHIAVPNIVFSEKISKIARPNGGCAYRIKAQNIGSRAAIDVQLIARFNYKSGRNARRIISVNEDGQYTHSPRLKGYKGNRIIDLVITPQQAMLLPPSDEIADKAKRQTLDISDVLNLPRAYIDAYVFAYDERTGVRKLYRSKKYTKADIVEARFDPNSVRLAGDVTDNSNETEDL